MTLLHHAVSTRVRYIFDIACVILAGAAALYLTYDLATLTYDSFRFGDLSDGIVKIAIWIPQSVMTVAVGILSISLIDALFELLRTGMASFSRSEAESAEAAYTS